MIVAYIDAHKHRFGVEPICRVLTSHGTPIAPSTYHAAKTTPVSPRDLADAYLTNALIDEFRANRRLYGLRTVIVLGSFIGSVAGRRSVPREDARTLQGRQAAIPSPMALVRATCKVALHPSDGVVGGASGGARTLQVGRPAARSGSSDVQADVQGQCQRWSSWCHRYSSG